MISLSESFSLSGNEDTAAARIKSFTAVVHHSHLYQIATLLNETVLGTENLDRPFDFKIEQFYRYQRVSKRFLLDHRKRVSTCVQYLRTSILNILERPHWSATRLATLPGSLPLFHVFEPQHIFRLLSRKIRKDPHPSVISCFCRPCLPPFSINLRFSWWNDSIPT